MIVMVLLSKSIVGNSTIDGGYDWTVLKVYSAEGFVAFGI